MCVKGERGGWGTLTLHSYTFIDSYTSWCSLSALSLSLLPYLVFPLFRDVLQAQVTVFEHARFEDREVFDTFFTIFADH